MHIFISWSGKRAGAVAKALDVFLTDVLNDVTTFISHDLGGGTRWSEEIDTNLDLADYGIVCLTKDRFRAPWINYEAGALGRAVPGKERKRVVPLLLDSTNPNDVPQPLSLFNVSLTSREAISMRLHEINSLVERPARTNAIDRRADSAWAELEKALDAAKVAPEDPIEEVSAVPSATTDAEKLDEILSYVRHSANRTAAIAAKASNFPPLSSTAASVKAGRQVSREKILTIANMISKSLKEVWTEETSVRYTVSVRGAVNIIDGSVVADADNTYGLVRVREILKAAAEINGLAASIDESRTGNDGSVTLNFSITPAL